MILTFLLVCIIKLKLHYLAAFQGVNAEYEACIFSTIAWKKKKKRRKGNMKRDWGWIKIPKVSKREAYPTHSILLSYINAASYLFHDTQTLFMTYQCKSGGTCTNNTVVLRNQLQMYTAGHVYVFVSTKGSLWCWNTSGPWREKHCWYASHGFLWVFIFIFIYFFQLEAFSWMCTLEFCESCFGEKTLTAIIRFAIISSTRRINWAGISGMIWCKTNILSPGACKYL